MSAGAYNPVQIPDLRNLQKAAASGECKLPPKCALSKIRRNLFEPVNHESSRKFLEIEMMKIQAEDSDKRSFDFLTGTPLAGPNRYAWERVNKEKTSPEADSGGINSTLGELMITEQSGSIPKQQPTLQTTEEPSGGSSEYKTVQ